MAKELDRKALVEQFEKDAAKAQGKIDRLTEQEERLTERRDAIQASLDEVAEKKAAEQTKIDALDERIQWANSFPGADNAAPVVSDESFGEATVADEDEPVRDPA